MMNNRFFLALLTLIFFGASCNKDDGTTPLTSQVKKIIHDGDGATVAYEFHYNTSGKVDSITVSESSGTDYTKVFNHYTGLIVSSIPSVGAGNFIDSIWLDNNE